MISTTYGVIAASAADCPHHQDTRCCLSYSVVRPRVIEVSMIRPMSGGGQGGGGVLMAGCPADKQKYPLTGHPISPLGIGRPTSTQGTVNL